MSHPDTPTSPPPPEPQSTRPQGPRRKRLHRATLATLIGVALGIVLITRSGLLKFLILPQIESLMPCDASCGRVMLASTGELIIFDLSLEAPGVTGPASQILFAPKVQIELALDSWWPGSLRVGRIELFDPVVRISQAEDLSLNLGPLFMTRRTPSGKRIPEVKVVEGTLELGEHGQGSYVPIVSLDVQGGVEADSVVDGVYNIDLIGDPQKLPGARALADLGSRTHVEGTIDLNMGAFTLEADNINLTELSAQSAPRSFRGYWEELGLRGLIPSATVSYQRDEGLAARFDLIDVDLAIPVPVTEEAEIEGSAEPTETAESLDMTDVTGEIHFDRRGLRAVLEGRVEDLACNVTLQTQGLSIDAPLTCRIETEQFLIVKGQKPRLLPFAPAFAQRVFRRFTSPGATLEGQVVIQRVVDDAGRPDWLYEGAFDLEEGQAQYDQFPYPFVNIEASFIFDQDSFELARISGVGRGTDAKLLASGVIAPPGREAGVDVDVTIVDLPMDEVFKRSLPERVRPVYETLFSDSAYQRHVDRGTILKPRDAQALEQLEQRLRREIDAAERDGADENAPSLADLRADLEDVRRRLQTPRLSLGGTATLRIRIHRAPGIDQRYDADVDFEVADAGVMPSAFPYPAVADTVAIRMAGGVATIDRFDLTGLTGAQGAIEGHVEYPPDMEEAGNVRPFLTIEARHVPIDTYLISALPNGDDAETDDEAPSLATSPRDTVRSLHLDGTVSCDASIGPRPDGSIGFDVHVRFDDLAAMPRPELRFDHVAGLLRVSNDRLALRGLGGTLGDRPFTFDLDATFPREGDQQPPTLSGDFQADDLDIAQPIESLLALASPDRADRLTALRKTHNPSGRLDARLTFSQGAGDLEYNLRTRQLSDIAFDAFGTRLRLDRTEGQIGVTDHSIEFEAFRTDVLDEGAPVPTRLALDGDFAREPGIEGRLQIGVEEGRFESPIIDAAARAIVPAAQQAIDSWRPEGTFDLQATRISHADDHEPTLDWTIEPHTLSVLRNETRIAFTEIDGRVSLIQGVGRAQGLRLVADTWSARADGAWGLDPALNVDLSVGLEAGAISPGLIGVMPDPVSEVLGAIELEVDERLALEEGRVRYRAGAGDGEVLAAFDGAITYRGLSAAPGVSLSDARGEATIAFELREGAPKPDFAVDIACESFRVLGVEMTGGHALLEQGDHPDAHLLRHFEAHTNAGRVTGRAVFANAQRMGLSAPGRSYEIHAEVTGVQFGPMLAQLRRARREGEPGGGDGAGREPEEGPLERGVLDASFTLFGAFEDESLRRGRGTVRVEGGDVLNMPGIVPLLELSNLQAPAGEKIDLAFADFFVVGDRLLFDDLYLYSPSIRITGRGEMAWPSTELDMRIETRGMRQIPVLSDILTSVREEIVSTRVAGTLYDPEFRYEQLSGARRLFGTMIGGDSNGRRTR